MSPLVQPSEAFATWARAELATFYAEPCPDEVMSDLVDRAHDAQNNLTAMPALDCEHLVMKLFPVFLALFEPARDAHPLLPSYDGEGTAVELSGFAAIMADFERLVPAIRDAMAPANWTRERAA